MTASPGSVRHRHRFSSTALQPAPRMMFSGLNVNEEDTDAGDDDDDVRSKS